MKTKTVLRKNVLRERARSRGESRWPSSCCSRAVALLCTWKRWDPTAADQRNIKESQDLMETANKRWLTEAEFDRVVALLHCDTEAAQLSAIITLEMVVGRAPPLRDRAIVALEGCPETSSLVVREEAARAIDRLKARQAQW